MSSPEVPEVLWSPDPERASGSALAAFARRVGVPELDYAALHAWSVQDVARFWTHAVDFLGVRFHDRPRAALGSDTMPGAQWFPGATLNYAEHALATGPGHGDEDLAVVFVREDGAEACLTFGELRDQVARARAGLLRLGVGRGDRVAAYAPNVVPTLVLFLAAASLGAIWSSCSPDFGPRAVQDRFTQIEPAVLLAVRSYRYGGKEFDIGASVRALREALPGLRATVLIDDGVLDDGLIDVLDGPPVGEPGRAGADVLTWAQLLAEPADLAFDPVPFDHPLWVLYSSGTTGLPKAIVHSQGGIVVEHLKALRLQLDLGPGDRFFWFTTTGWMMWNLLVGGLMVGAAVVLYDGNPGYPDLHVLWAMAARHKVTFFGASAPFLHANLKDDGLHPGAEFDLSCIRAVGSTGAPLSAEGFRWVEDTVGLVQLCSISGGTDICTALVGAAPTLPVWLGEIPCAQLGVAVEVFDEAGRHVEDEVGELVVTRPMPSMPTSFWHDPDGTRLRAAYYEDFPGVWRHGDWIRRTPRGSYVIYGRSDSTLNRGGVRMGTAEFYAVVEAQPGVRDSLVVDTGQLLCFVVLEPGAVLAELEPGLRAALRAQLSPRHVPDRFIAVPAVPRTLNGKKCEVPVKRILAGVDPAQAVSVDALADPGALAPFVALVNRP